MNIVIRGARTHNLKNIDVTIPRNKLSVLTGVSGSGKSSLAFDTIYIEGQRRYIESLSTYARQFLEQLSRPEIESIEGLSPTISIEQQTISTNPRSTVGTVTEIYDYLRLLYSKISKAYCWKCDKPIQSQTSEQILNHLLSFSEGTRVSILAPILKDRKGEHQKELLKLQEKGFSRIRIDGVIRDLSETILLEKNKKHSVELYVDRIILRKDIGLNINRIRESIELALKLGNGGLILQVLEGSSTKESLMSEKFSCLTCKTSYPDPETRTFSFNSPLGACKECDGLGTLFDKSCTSCSGTRLRKESLQFKIGTKNIAELSELSIFELRDFFNYLKISEREKKISERIIKEIQSRLNFITEVGVGYINLNRSIQTLSGGEAQRIRLATQIGTSLVGVTYILDEPSIGLHQRDNAKLISTLKKLRDIGNTVIVVEHDRDTIEQADWVIDLGPGAGTQGGEVIFSGTSSGIQKSKKSLTGKYLSGELKFIPEKNRRPITLEKSIKIEGAHFNNLKNIDVQFPIGIFTCVTGVSGSGKSTLVIDILYHFLLQHFQKKPFIKENRIHTLSGLNFIDKVVEIDQKPIGRTPRSNPATYTGIFSIVRSLFSSLPESKIRGFSSGRYSFNTKGGRCEHCEGNGIKKIEMHFLPDFYIECDSCQGKRYNKDILEIKYKGKSIADILSMTSADALLFFDSVPHIKSKLKLLNEVGLGYLQLGQSATTLSGGETQRLKLSSELSKRSTGKTVYILDEPSTGLHFDDVKKLLILLHALVDQGNTVIVIEHNLDIIRSADYIIDLGPEGGNQGGKILARGTPEEIASHPESHTGLFLKHFFKN